MGMYTELVLKCEIKETAPEEVKDILRFLFGELSIEPILPEHRFFTLPRWRYIGKGCSFYHHPNPVSDCYESDFSSSMRIFSRSDIKNYDEEIEYFLNWLHPYIDEWDDECIGWYWYEEDSSPSLLYASLEPYVSLPT